MNTAWFSLNTLLWLCSHGLDQEAARTSAWAGQLERGAGGAEALGAHRCACQPVCLAGQGRRHSRVSLGSYFL